MVDMREPEDLLRSAMLRVTRPRTAVLEAVRSHPHADADTITGVVRGELGTVSKQAVYDVLAALTELELDGRVCSEAGRWLARKP